MWINDGELLTQLFPWEGLKNCNIALRTLVIEHPLKLLRMYSASKNKGEKCHHGYSLSDIYGKVKILKWQKPCVRA